MLRMSLHEANKILTSACTKLQIRPARAEVFYRAMHRLFYVPEFGHLTSAAHSNTDLPHVETEEDLTSITLAHIQGHFQIHFHHLVWNAEKFCIQAATKFWNTSIGLLDFVQVPRDVNHNPLVIYPFLTTDDFFRPIQFPLATSSMDETNLSN